MAHNLSLCWIRPKGNKGHYWLTTLKGFSAAHCAVKWYQLLSFHNYLALQTYALSFYTSKFLRGCAKTKKKHLVCSKKSLWSLHKSTTLGCFIYILDSSNSSSITFWTSQFSSSSRSIWTGIWTGNSNGSWTDKQSSHFSTAKEMSVKATFFFM